MALPTTVSSHAGRTARHGLAALTSVPPGAVAAGLAVLAGVLGWQGADAPNYIFRIDLFQQAGFTVWNMAWYGGHYTVGYSALLPPLGALLGPAALGVASVAVAAVSFDRLVSRSLAAVGPRPRAAALLFAAGTVTNLAVGRLAFALGLAAGLAAVVAAVSGRWKTAGALSIATTLASPVAGVFLALAWAASVLSHHRSRSTIAATVCGGLTIAPIAVSVLLFPEGGTFPFRWTSLLFVLGASGLAFALVPPQYRVVRVGATLYAAAGLATFVVATPLGGNLERLGMYLAAPILVAIAPLRRVLLLVAALPLLLWWQWAPALDGMLRAGADPSTDSAYHEPLIDFIQRQPGVVGRIEIPFTERHFETAYVAPVVPLARGWERQLDILGNPLFYNPGLDADSYRAWLLATGVEYVALPDAPLDPSAHDEAEIITHGQPYLEAVWRSAHWQVWRVVGSPGVVSGHAELAARDANSMVIDAHAPGTVLVRERWTGYWSVDGPACVEPSPDGCTRLQVSRAGRLVLQPVLIGAENQCPT